MAIRDALDLGADTYRVGGIPIATIGSIRARFASRVNTVARRKLLQIHAATELASLRIPPGNQLEALKADRKGQQSIRINGESASFGRPME